MDTLERFYSHVTVLDLVSCWPWNSFCNPKGYGVFGVGGSTELAHRWLLGYMRGTPLRWDDELREMGCHDCDNPPCCNLSHLYVGDAFTNAQDAKDRDRFYRPSLHRTHCKNLHEINEINTAVDRNGKLRCRVCDRDAWRLKTHGQLELPAHEFCANGHRWDVDNNERISSTTGWRECRACDREKQRARYQAGKRRVS